MKTPSSPLPPEADNTDADNAELLLQAARDFPPAQPSPAVEAAILRAAHKRAAEIRQAAADLPKVPAAQPPSLLRRFSRWLFGDGRLRYATSVGAFVGVAAVAVAVWVGGSLRSHLLAGEAPSVLVAELALPSLEEERPARLYAKGAPYGEEDAAQVAAVAPATDSLADKPTVVASAAPAERVAARAKAAVPPSPPPRPLPPALAKAPASPKAEPVAERMEAASGSAAKVASPLPPSASAFADASATAASLPASLEASAQVSPPAASPLAASAGASFAQKAQNAARLASFEEADTEKAVPEKALEEALRRVLQLRREGKEEEAQKLLKQLRERFPDEKLEERLRRLEEEDK